MFHWLLRWELDISTSLGFASYRIFQESNSEHRSAVLENQFKLMLCGRVIHILQEQRCRLLINPTLPRPLPIRSTGGHIGGVRGEGGWRGWGHWFLFCLYFLFWGWGLIFGNNAFFYGFWRFFCLFFGFWCFFWELIKCYRQISMILLPLNNNNWIINI